MKIYNSLEELNIEEKTAVALGTFDGIHIGHVAILKSALEAAKVEGCKSLCYTFSNPPLNYIKGLEYEDDDAVRLICTEEEKCKILREMGFDYLVNLPFDSEVMHMPARTFTRDILKDKLNADIVCCGFNYTYGDKAEGEVNSLLVDGNDFGFRLMVHDEIKLNGKTVSSTLIRSLIHEGKFMECSEYLGRAFTIAGRVKHGNHLGSSMGFPTMNIVYPTELEKPPFGVYFSLVEFENITYPAVTNIGYRPTVGGKELLVESFAFGFNQQIYDNHIAVKLLSFKRPEMKFDSLDALKEQIALDCAEGKQFHHIID